MNLYYVKYEAFGIERQGYIRALNPDDIKKKLENTLHVIINILKIDCVYNSIIK